MVDESPLPDNSLPETRTSTPIPNSPLITVPSMDGTMATSAANVVAPESQANLVVDSVPEPQSNPSDTEVFVLDRRPLKNLSAKIDKGIRRELTQAKYRVDAADIPMELPVPDAIRLVAKSAFE